MRHPELLIIAFVILSWIVRTIIKFVKWSVKQVKTIGVAPSPIQQAIADAQRLQEAQATARLTPVLQYRRPDTGGLAVDREATYEDFDRAEQELFLSEPASLNSLQSITPVQQEAAPLRLFEDADDLVRAFILQEVLGPPLSRRAASH